MKKQKFVENDKSILIYFSSGIHQPQTWLVQSCYKAHTQYYLILT